MRMLERGIALVLLVGACTGSVTEPWDIADRPILESCNQDGVKVYLPVRQGSAHAAHASRTSADCIPDAYKAGEGREAEFVLVGDEADGSRAIIQTLPDGSVNYYVQIEADDWAVHEGCVEMTFSWFFNVSECAVQET